MRGNLCIGLATIKLSPKQFNITYILNYGRKIAKKLGLKVLEVCWCPYSYERKDQFTAILFLKESHIALETWPENEEVEITIASCKKLKKKQIRKAINKRLFSFSLFYKRGKLWR